jgi:uncharacterized protein (DUF58 family)
MKSIANNIKNKISVNNGEQLKFKNILVSPTKSGYVFLVVIIVMICFGLNYENNLILAVSFFVISVLVSSIYITYYNFKGLSLKVLPSEHDIFAHSITSIPIYITNTKKRTIRNFLVTTNNGPALFLSDIHINTETNINIPTGRRGYQKLPLIRISSDYPLGLFHVVSYIKPEQKILVLPKQETCEYLLQKIPQQNTAQPTNQEKLISSFAKGKDEISGLKQYRIGDPINLIDWRQYAKGRGLMVKEFSAEQSSPLYLTINSVKSSNTEEQISMLAYAVIDLSHRNIQFGFLYKGISCAPSNTRDHRQKILTSLATI